MKDWKNKITTYAGIAFGIAVGILAIEKVYTLPTWLTSASASVAAISGAIIGVLTGKNPDLTKKTDTQLKQVEKDKKP